jgi:hypothetical protein
MLSIIFTQLQVVSPGLAVELACMLSIIFTQLYATLVDHDSCSAKRQALETAVPRPRPQCPS